MEKPEIYTCPIKVWDEFRSTFEISCEFEKAMRIAICMSRFKTSRGLNLG